MEERCCFLYHRYVMKPLDPPCDNEIKQLSVLIHYYPIKLIIITSPCHKPQDYLNVVKVPPLYTSTATVPYIHKLHNYYP